MDKIKRNDQNQVKPKALMLASVASMIDLFNDDNINTLISLGYDVHVMANFQNGSITSQSRVDEFYNELIQKNISVFDAPIPRNLFKISAIISSYRQIKQLVNDNQYHIVHCHSPIGGVVCRLACREARNKNTKVIYTAHGFHFFNKAPLLNWVLFYPIEKICSRFTDILITINKEDYNRAKKFHARSVQYVPGIGVHTERFQNLNIDKLAKRSSFGIENDDFLIMSTGQISVRKNHEVIIRALWQLKNKKIKYMIVGFGELENKLKLLVEKLNLNDQIIFTGYRKDVNDLLAVADAFAFPSLQEGLPVALMEAMAAGLPIVCSNIRGNIDLIKEGENGYIVDCNDIDGFAKTIDSIYKDADQRKKMANLNREIIKKYDNSEVKAKMQQIYSMCEMGDIK